MIATGLVVSILFSLLPVISIATENSYSVKAEFVRELTPPGRHDSFLRPSRILVDRDHKEVLVSDPGNGRVLIFNTAGTMKFEFSVSEYCGAPTDMGLDSRGRIYILASARDGQFINIFDFDGQFISRFPVYDNFKQTKFNASSIALDENDNIYLLDASDCRIVCLSTDGEIKHQFPVLTDLADNLKPEQVFGTLLIENNSIYLPVSTLGRINRYSLDGQDLGHIGRKGTTMGELNFPVAVAVTPDGLVMVLDKHRYNVVCYSGQGVFLGEFGGKGINPGWFYHPTWLAVDDSNQAYIGQIYNNKVQVCRIPNFIRDRLHQQMDVENADIQIPDQMGIRPDNSLPGQNEINKLNIINIINESLQLSKQENNKCSSCDGTINIQRGGILNA